jgi:hypothetical protein
MYANQGRCRQCEAAWLPGRLHRREYACRGVLHAVLRCVVLCCMHGHVQHSTAQHTRCPVKHSTHMGPRALEKARQHGGRVCACCMHGAAGGEKNVFWSGIVPGSLLWLHNIIRPPWRAQKGLCEEGHSTAAGVLRCAQRAGHVGTRVCGLLLGLLSLLVPVCLFHPGVCHPWGHAGPRLLQISLHQARELLAAAACCLCLSAAGWVGAAIPLQAIYKHAGLPAFACATRGAGYCWLLPACCCTWHTLVCTSGGMGRLVCLHTCRGVLWGHSLGCWADPCCFACWLPCSHSWLA